MHAIKPNNKEFAWIISPYRELIDSSSVRTWLDNKVKKYNAKFVCVHANEASFSLYEGMDFGRTLAKISKHKNFIYVEYRDEYYVLVHIKNGKLFEDRLLSSESELVSALTFISSTNDDPVNSSYEINYFGLTEQSTNDEILEKFEGITKSPNMCTEITNSLFETIEISDLKDDEVFYYVEFKNAVRDLADTKTQKVTLFSIVAIVLFIFALNTDTFNFDEQKERLELVDDYKEYTQLLMNGNSFSARLAQDFKIHKLLNSQLPNWSLYKVTHTIDAIEYRLLPQSHKASVKSLTLFAEHYGMAVLNDSNGLGIVGGIDKQPVYTMISEIRRYPIEELTANLIDIESNVTPFATIRVKRTEIKGAWAERELGIVFSGASNHDLLRIAAIVDGYPERYPTFFSSCQSQGCSYDVSPQGVLKGVINFTIYGNSRGADTNGK